MVNQRLVVVLVTGAMVTVLLLVQVVLVVVVEETQTSRAVLETRVAMFQQKEIMVETV
jgi:hypothetical protein